jgi:gliding motility-associated-like protein
MKKIILCFLFASAFLLPGFGQITVVSSMTVEDYVQNVLLGNGVTATNITYNNGAANSQQINVSYFTDGGTAFPISAGLLLSTGNGNVAIGPNNSTNQSAAGTPNVAFDTDLQDISGANVTNGVVLEFDFVPEGDTLSFKYMWASEEYPEFAPPNGGVNDVFGFFISGPGFAGPYENNAENIAIIPGTTTPIAINNVNAITNQTYYVDNTGGVAYGNAIEYDGTTIVMTANASVICGETYHIKLAVSNVLDQGWDSGVFLEAGSFVSPPVDVNITTANGDNFVAEGCVDANLYFIRNACDISDTLIVAYEITGTAIEGTDYQNIPNPVTMLPFQDTAVINIIPIVDAITEGDETITIHVYLITPNGDTIVTGGTLIIGDLTPLSVTAMDDLMQCIGDSALLSATSAGGSPPINFSWSTGDTGPMAYSDPIMANGSYQFIVTATDGCGGLDTDTMVAVMNQTLAMDTILVFDATACNPDGAVSAIVTGLTGQPLYHWYGPGNPGTYQIDASVLQNIPSGWYYFSVEDNVCSVEDSAYVDQLDPPIASVSADVTSGCEPLVVTLTNSSQNANVFQWNFGNGNAVTVNDMSSQTQTYITGAVVQLIAFQGNCSDTAYVPINAFHCGCTDPTALNFDPFAVADDGSCTYPIPPIPTVETYNVFTPGDSEGENDMFYVTTTNAANVELKVFNRWGNEVYSGSGENPAWDGKSNGVDVTEGVYFYTYIVTGFSGETLEGHGFVNVVRQ